ncbi:hypothetical protein Aoki45_18930 [Algoriphagus sp. oki45]|uniref:hypothetical protein n=1 Tax=Algoriphagus sp. oki45 TaxID=3067294 RepID=UPI0027EBCEB1|nr:hypothetical protein Aoki45_18930 [Algoriphagus sp. oki45]
MKKITFLGIILLVLAIGGYFVFDQLGGNTPIEIELVEKRPDTLAGKTFRGTPQDPKLRENFQEIEQAQALNPGTKIHTIYYVEPAGKLDMMEVFVGINLPFASGDLERKTFEEDRYLLAKIRGSKWVMPGPEKVKAQLQDFASKYGWTLSGVYIDKIISESEVQVIAPIK